jgi:hypothetical protein
MHVGAHEARLEQQAEHDEQRELRRPAPDVRAPFDQQRPGKEDGQTRHHRVQQQATIDEEVHRGGVAGGDLPRRPVQVAQPVRSGVSGGQPHQHRRDQGGGRRERDAPAREQIGRRHRYEHGERRDQKRELDHAHHADGDAERGPQPRRRTAAGRQLDQHRQQRQGHEPHVGRSQKRGAGKQCQRGPPRQAPRHTADPRQRPACDGGEDHTDRAQRGKRVRNILVVEDEAERAEGTDEAAADPKAVRGGVVQRGPERRVEPVGQELRRDRQ